MKDETFETLKSIEDMMSDIRGSAASIDDKLDDLIAAVNGLDATNVLYLSAIARNLGESE